MDKVQKIREEVEIVVNRRLNLLNGDYFDLNEETDGLTNEIMDIIDPLQEEPTTSVWHYANEKPEIGKPLLFRRVNGELQLAVVSGVDYYFEIGEMWAYVDDLLEL